MLIMMMDLAFQHIGLIGIHQNPAVSQTLVQTVTFLERLGCKVSIEPHTYASIEQVKMNAQPKPLNRFGRDCDLVICIGGDGNMLAAARTASRANVPLIGINRGKLGFLTDINPEHLDEQLLPILKGDYEQTTRFLIEGAVLHANGHHTAHGNALNDIVLFPGELLQSIKFELYINDHFVSSQQADGLIIATPTGSTAYSLSAGGPVMYPDLNALVLVPMYPHTLTNRPIVIDANDTIKLYISDHNKINPRLSFDGQEHVNLQKGDTITIKQQQQQLRLLHPKGYNYFEVLRKKLHWGTPLIRL